MKKYLLAALLALTVPALTGCGEDDSWWLETSMWTVVDSYGRPTTATLSFNGPTVAVQGAAELENWPLDNGLWSYYIDGDGDAHFSMDYEYWDGDGYVGSTESHTMRLEVSEEGSQMVLTYDPWLGSARRFYLIRN